MNTETVAEPEAPPQTIIELFEALKESLSKLPSGELKEPTTLASELRALADQVSAPAASFQLGALEFFAEEMLDAEDGDQWYRANVEGLRVCLEQNGRWFVSTRASAYGATVLDALAEHARDVAALIRLATAEPSK